MKIRLAPEYGCAQSEQLDIPGALADRIDDWWRRYDATFDERGQQRITTSCRAGFDSEGRKLWLELSRALGPAYRVCYYSLLDERWIGED